MNSKRTEQNAPQILNPLHHSCEQLRMTLIISSLGAGGAQRALTTLANHWAEKGWRLTLLTLDDGLSPPFFPLHPQIELLPLGLYAESRHLLAKITNNFRRLFILRQAIAASRPQMVLCFMDRTNILVLFANLFSPIPVIVSERIHPAVGIGCVWEKLRKLIYPKAIRIVVLTKRTFDAFPVSWQRKMVVIPNPVLVPGISILEEKTDNKKENFTIVSAGRLTEQKGYDLLIRAFAKLAKKFSSWNMLILGEGPQRAELEHLRDRLKVKEKVHFAGNNQDLECCLRKADLFVLSSRFEGFPNILCEAMACGLAVVATDCPTGPREIVRPQIDGLLVAPENVDALAAAMASLMANEKRRKELGRRATEIIDRFGLAEVDRKWEQLFADVLSKK